MQTNEEFNITGYDRLFVAIKQRIDEAKNKVAVEVNYAMTALYWEIGNTINTGVLCDGRADYGRQVVAKLARQLQQEYGSQSFSEKNLRRMMQFASVFPNREIVASVLRQFSWSHFTLLIPIQDELKRNFYMEMCRIEHWSVRTLRQKIDGMLYERTTISKQCDDVIKQDLKFLKEKDKMSPDLVFRDPYFLDFLGLHDSYSEKDVENAILSEMEKFISEFGTDFAFLARQKRITIDNEDYYIDLLFFHRRLHCLVAIDLKLGEFKAAYKGQMELYLRWLEKYDRVEGEYPPIGLILCAGKNQEHVELMYLDESNIRVAEYMLQLPEKRLLEDKLNKAVAYAKNKLQIGEINAASGEINATSGEINVASEINSQSGEINATSGEITEGNIEKLLRIIAENPGIKRSRLHECMGIPLRTLDRLLSALAKAPEPRIRYIGSKKTGGWFVS